MIQAGRLRHRVEIQEVTETRGEGGKVIETWTTKNVVYASIRPSKGEEFLNARGQVLRTVSHVIVIRHTTGVTPGDRIKYGTRIFGIEAVLNNMERDAMMTIGVIEPL